jgi:two-component system response regulator HydG
MNPSDNLPMARILIADDEPLYLRTTGELLRKAGYECECVADAHAAFRAMQHSRFDLLLSDLNMPGNLKLELLHHGRSEWPDVPLIVITGVPSLPTAIESLRLGIADYLIKPVKYDDLLSSIRRALANRTGLPKILPPGSDLPPTSTKGLPYSEIIGDSPPMKELFRLLERISRVDTNVLITGESGTGKEVVARSIHQQSARSRHPFRIIDCTAIPESLFESVLFGHAKGAFTGAIKDQKGLLSASHQGTAFFDEIGELPLVLQSKLLRAVQEQTFTPVGQTTSESLNTRFVCATNRDLAAEVTAGRFRRDLFYRLAVIHLELPPLRDRSDDVILLAQHFLHQLQPDGVRVTGFSEEVLSCFRRYSWPGNVRELRNVVERTLAFARSSQITMSDLPAAVQSDAVPQSADEISIDFNSRQRAMDDAEHRYLVSLLKSHGGNVSKAAHQAGVSRQGMHKMLSRHGINAADFRE